MTWHLYFVPIIGDGTKLDPRRPKYMTGEWSAMDYGMHPVMLVAANVDNVTDTALQLNADVYRVPDTLDQLIGAGVLALVQNALETRNLPAEWVIAETTYRVLLRTIAVFFAFFQRYTTVANTTALFFGGAVTLNTRINQLTAQQRQDLAATATSLGLDFTAVSNAATLRTALKILADQWGQHSVQIGGLSI